MPAIPDRTVAELVRLSSACAIGLMVVGLACAAESDPTCRAAQDRTIQFLANAYTGNPMKPGQWFTADALSSPNFKWFGGLNELVRQSTTQARNYGGLGSITVEKSELIAQSCKITAQIRFMRDHRDPARPPVAGNEDLIWDLFMVKQNGSWRIAK